MKAQEARRLAQEKIEQLGKELERGHSETLRAYLAAMAKLHTYSLHNVLLIAAQKPDAQHVAGFGTWRRLGRCVRRGERGIAILAPIVRRRERVADLASDSHEASEECSLHGAGEAVMGFRGAYVFDVSQTEGAPLPEFAVVAGNPGPYTERLQRFTADRGIQLRYSHHIAPARGACIGDTIVLLPELSPAEHLSTLAHELGHQSLHRRDGREQVSKTVREAIGLATGTSSSDYVQLWGGDTKTLSASLDRIQRTAAEIIAAIGPDV
jgi:hypothetical protein